MDIGVFSVLMSAVSGSCLVLIVHLLRRQQPVMKAMGVRTLLLLQAVSVLRLAFVFELPFAEAFKSRKAYMVFREMRLARIPIGTGARPQLNLVDLLVMIWLAVAAVQLALFLFRQFRALRSMSRFAGNRSPQAERILRKIMDTSKRKVDVKLCICPGLEIPMGAGIIHKRIYLPDTELTDQELYYILKHEYTHFCGFDLHIKLFVCMLCRVFWWNPVLYLLLQDLEQLLEIRCDLTATRDMDNQEKANYLTVLLALLRNDPARGKGPKPSLPVASGLFSNRFSARPNTLERFELIAKPGKLAGRIARRLLLAGFTVIMALSMIFVVHPAYYNMDHINFHGPGYLRAYSRPDYTGIIKREDGTYVRWDGERETRVSEEYARYCILMGMFADDNCNYYEDTSGYDRILPFHWAW